MKKFVAVCIRGQYGHYYFPAHDEADAKRLAEGFLENWESFDGVYDNAITLVGIEPANTPDAERFK